MIDGTGSIQITFYPLLIDKAADSSYYKANMFENILVPKRAMF